VDENNMKHYEPNFDKIREILLRDKSDRAMIEMYISEQNWYTRERLSTVEWLKKDFREWLDLRRM
jgi:hypothetical protein